jgi:DNA polymerase-3 subunit gamma/tau
VSYLVLARKWRPSGFDEVLGQDHVVRTLVNGIKSGRIPHAFLFTGPRGVGKTSMARILAKALDCLGTDAPTGTPCGQCAICRDAGAGSAIDVIEIDGASNNLVDDVRVLRDNVRYLPNHARYKVYIIDEVHMLSKPAFNALLKTLEEPPAHVKFILATTEPHKIPDTILSRCQRFDFRRIPVRLAVQRLAAILDQERIGYEEAALALIVRRAGGSMRDALSLLDQVIAFAGDRVTATATAEVLGAVERRLVVDAGRALLERDARACLDVVRVLADRGHDAREFVDELAHHLRDMLVIRTAGPDGSATDLPADEAEEIAARVREQSPHHLARLFQVLMDSAAELARSEHPRIVLEMALVRLASLEPLRSLDDVLAEVAALQSHLADVPPAGGAPGTTQGGAAGGGRRDPVAPPPPPPVAAAPRTTATNVERGADVARPEPAPTPPPSPATPAPTADAAAPPPAPPPAATPAPATPRPATWLGFVDAVGARSARLGGFLRLAHPVKFTSAAVTIGIARENALVYDHIAAADSVRTLVEVAQGLFDAAPSLEVTWLAATAESDTRSLAQQDEEERARAMERKRSEAFAHDVVRAAEMTFPGAEVTVRAQ